MADSKERPAVCLTNASIAARIRRDYRNIPIPTMIFSGTQTPSETKKIEAFVFQVNQFAAEKRTLSRHWKGEAQPGGIHT